MTYIPKKENKWLDLRVIERNNGFISSQKPSRLGNLTGPTRAPIEGINIGSEYSALFHVGMFD